MHLPPETVDGISPTSAGTEVGVAQFGDPRGRPVLFFHGWPGSRWQGLVAHEAARERGIRFIALDRPGYGRTTLPGGLPLLDWADAVSEVADHLELSDFDLVGLSGGGPSACACAFRFPERIRSVQLLCAAPPFAETGGTAHLMPALRLLLRIRKRSERLSRICIAVAAHTVMRFPAGRLPLLFYPILPPADRRLLRNPELARQVVLTVREGIRRHPRVILEDGDRLLAPWDFAFGDLRPPVEIWHGTADRTIPFAYADAMHRRLPRSQFHRLEAEGHYSLPWNHAASVLQRVAEG